MASYNILSFVTGLFTLSMAVFKTHPCCSMYLQDLVSFNC